MNKGDSSGQYGPSIQPGKYNFVNSVATRVKNRAYVVGGRLRVGTAMDRGLNPMPVRAVEIYGGNYQPETKTSNEEESVGQKSNNSNSSNNDIDVINSNNGRWVDNIKVYDPKIGHVKKRVGHVAETLLNDQFIYVFGGEIIDDDTVPGKETLLNDTVRVKVTGEDGMFLQKLRWEEVPIVVPEEDKNNAEFKSEEEDSKNEDAEEDGESSNNSMPVPVVPESRRWHASSKVTDIEFAIFGGLNSLNQPLGNLCVFDALQNMWQVPTTSGEEPSPRYRHNMIGVPLANPPNWPPVEKPPVEEKVAIDEEGEKDNGAEEVNVEEESEEDKCLFIRATPGDVFASIVILGGDYYPKLEKGESIVLDAEEMENGSVSGSSKDGGGNAEEEEGEKMDDCEMGEEDEALPPLSTSGSMHVLTVTVADDGLDRVWTWSEIKLTGSIAPMLSLRRWYQTTVAYDLDYKNPKDGNLKRIIIVYGGRRREGLAPSNMFSIGLEDGEVNTLKIRDANDMVEAYGEAPNVYNDVNFFKPSSLIGHTMLSLNGNTSQTVTNVNNEIDITVTTPPLSEILIFGGWDGRSHRGDIASLSLQTYVSLEDIRIQKEKEMADDRTIKTPTYEYHGDTKVVGLGRVRHGKGVNKYQENNNEYNGEYENDLRNGSGVYLDNVENLNYEGKWSQDKRCGKGIEKYLSTDDARESFEGTWFDDRYNGNGIIVFKNGVQCNGTWVDGKLLNNKGKLLYPEGAVYDGEIAVGEDMTHYKNGQGKFIYANKEIYEGEWKFDKRYGVGKQYYNNGDEYTGNWRNDRKNGFGEMIFWNRNKYHGKWVANQMNGTGTMKYAAGHVYSGTWKNSKRHGRGRFSKRDGEVIEGRWEDGKQKIGNISRKK
jgi:hypothetical protein